MSRLKITQTLLSSWLYSYELENGYQDFLDTLQRKKKPPTKQMLDGIRFEGCVNAVLNGEIIEPDHEWYKPVRQLSRYLKGAQQQVSIFKPIKVTGVDFVLNGVLDFLKAGIIYDTKFSKHYKVGKYLKSTQTPMYFELVPEVRRFEYLICDGKFIYKEAYRPDEVENIRDIISNFMGFLEQYNLVDEYIKHWKMEE